MDTDRPNYIARQTIGVDGLTGIKRINQFNRIVYILQPRVLARWARRKESGACTHDITWLLLPLPAEVRARLERTP